ncbi:MAG: VOC family protein [Candidatus Latescibacterota bacterium]|nr:VOC family protein [Candidatus Latescibacterota bacterium]
MNPLNKIGIQCNNVEEAVSFYVQALGMEVIERFAIENGQDYVYLKSDELIIELMPNKKEEQAKIHHLSFSSSNLREDTDKLISNNAVATKEPFDVGTGNIKLAFFLDQDGTNIQLYERQQPNRDAKSNIE